jgi:hypothetical protein|tara:strand:+ start:84 stop:260 length:177 start_codon:yes stop_codon:yes gene_type:complete
MSTNQKRNRFLIATFFVMYSLFWHIPHCCSPMPFTQNVKQINAITFAQPYAGFMKYIK